MPQAASLSPLPIISRWSLCAGAVCVFGTWVGMRHFARARATEGTTAPWLVVHGLGRHRVLRCGRPPSSRSSRWIRPLTSGFEPVGRNAMPPCAHFPPTPTRWWRRATRVALTVGSHLPFWPLYIFWATGWEALPSSLLTAAMTPLFLAIPIAARCNGLLGRVLTPHPGRRQYRLHDLDPRHQFAAPGFPDSLRRRRRCDL